ncbi:hypothetical protein KKF61_02045, partial [Patescibacteria group bacterium]|nr:hypothetical protein [Patescibacteria group bacterium]
MAGEQPQANCPFCGFPVETKEHSLDCPNANFKQKDAADLEQQFRFAQAQHLEEYPRPESMPEPVAELLSLSPKEFKARLDGDASLNEHYQTYLNKLRELKRETKRYFRDQAKERDIGEEPICSRPPEQLFTRILKRVQGGGKSFDEKLFRDDELEEAKQDPDKFFELLNRTIVEHPRAIIYHGDRLRALFKPEDYKKMVIAAAEKSPTDFLVFAHHVHDFFDDSELNDLLQKACKDGRCIVPESIMKNEKVKGRVNTETRKSIVEALGNDNLMEHLDEYMAEGLVTEDQARDTYLRYLNDEFYIGGDAYKYEPKYLEL